MDDITFDESQRPIIIVQFKGAPDDSNFDGYLRRLTEIACEPGRVAVVIDTTGSTPITPAQRKRQAEWMRENWDVLKEHSAGVAFVFTSAIFRFALSGILLLQRTPVPYSVWSTRDEALAWARERLRASR